MAQFFSPFVPVKHVHFVDETPPQKPHHHHHHFHHHHHHFRQHHRSPPTPTLPTPPPLFVEQIRITHRHHTHRHRRPSPPPPQPPTPECPDCRLTFATPLALSHHRARNPRHCPQHLLCFADWSTHCFQYDHIKCPRSTCRDLPPFRSRERCLEHLRAWHAAR